MRRPQPSQDRRALLAMAHLAAKELGLDDDTRRDVQRQVTGRESCCAMSDRQLRALLDHYRALGWTKRPPRKARAKQQAKFPQARLIRALWLELRDLGELRDASEQALRGYVRRITGVAALEWLAGDEVNLRLLIETLKKWVARVRVARAVDEIAPAGGVWTNEALGEVCRRWDASSGTVYRELRRRGWTVEEDGVQAPDRGPG